MTPNDKSTDVTPEMQSTSAIVDEYAHPTPAATIIPGSGAIAHGDHAVAVGERGVAIDGNVSDSLIVTGDYNNYQSSNPDKEDIERLKRYTRSTRALLSDSASFAIGSTTVKVKRSAVDTLQAMVASGSVIINGAPGIGKSGVLLDWLHRLDDTQTDYIFLAASNIVAHDSAHLRIPDDLSQDLVEVLIKWPGTAPAYLVIDALDGAKDSRTAATLVHLIKRLLQRQSRWRVVVSIREFDLSHHSELRKLFKGEPAQAAQHPDYSGVRHLYINEFSAEELSQIVIQAPQLTPLLLQPESPLAGLLKVPFNLRLTAELLDTGVALATLSPLQSQVELLDRFWEARVLQPSDQADARELLLRRCIMDMIEQRTLRCNRADIILHPEDGAILESLLSCHILANWRPSATGAPERELLTFAHHILFDFAVAHLLFRASDQRWIERTLENPDLIFIAYPSYVFYFHHLWHRHPSHTDFWQSITSAFTTANLSEITRTVGPTVATALAKEVTDLEAFLTDLEGVALPNRTTAERILPHLIDSLEAEPALVATHCALWCTVAQRLSAKLRPATVYPLNTLLQLLIQQNGQWSNIQWQQISTTARALLQFAWSAQPSNPRLINQAITAVCATYHVDPTSAATLLRRIVEPAHLAEYGYSELAPLADYIWPIAATDLDFARQIYTVAFAFTDERDEPVRLGGQIMSLTTTKRQQYHGVQWMLAEKYQHILTVAPVLGTQILIAVLNSYGDQPQLDSITEAVSTFQFRGKETKIRFPNKLILFSDEDEELYAHNDHITILKAADNVLCNQTDDQQNQQIRQQILDELAGQVLPMLLVRRLLKSAARHPTTLGMEVRELAWAIPLLIDPQTRQASEEFISAIFPIAAEPDRARIETTILSIPQSFPAQEQKHGKYIQDKLLLRLIPAKMVSQAAKASLLAVLQEQAKVEPLEFNVEGLFANMFGPYINQAARRATLVNDPHYQAVDSIQQTVYAIAPNLSNMSPSDEQVQALLHAIAELQAILSAQSQTEGHAIIVANAWSAVSEAASLIAHWLSLLDHPNVVHTVHELLLSAAQRPEPAEEFASVDDVLQTVNSSRPAARLYAAKGLLRLATLPGCADASVLNTLQTLANDPLPSVRILIAERIHLLEMMSPALMWELLIQRATTESHPTILHSLLHWPLIHLQAAHGERIIPMVQAIASRVKDAKDRVEVVDDVIWIYLQQYLVHQSAASQALLLQIADHPYEHQALAWRLPFQLRQSSKYGPKSNIAIQQRSDLFNQLISSTCLHCKKHIAELEQRPQDMWTEDEQMLRDLLGLANHLGHELFFLSGAFHARQGSSPALADDPPLLPEQAQLFWLNHQHSIRLLADLGLSALTHHLLEILDYIAPIAPVEVFVLFRDALRTVANSGYQYEKMGADLALKIINCFLSEHKAIFQEDPQCSAALLEVFDILLTSGWPDARKLAYQIHKVFR